jgi:stage II sporulation protein D (peptidoglycan lytic transglycosylase)
MKVLRCLAALLCVALPAASQSNNNVVTVSVRLYSLHPQQHLKIAARTGTLRWRTCESCTASEAGELLVRASGDEVHVENGPAAERIFVEGEYRIEPHQGLKIAFSAPLQLSATEGLLIVIAAVPLEDYVAAALEGESATSTRPESLKAMAVAVRTYAARFRPRHGEEGFDFCDNTHCQNLNFTGPTPAIRAAVEATRGELLWYRGEPAAAYYHQNCGGTLAAGEEVWPTVHEPYLRVHSDPYCKQGAPLPWKSEFSRGEFEKALRDQGLKVPEGWNSLVVALRGPSGRARELAFNAPSQPQQRLAASSLRFAIGRSFGWNRIRSDLYEVQSTPTSVIFSGHGAGHGVGLCQAGAEEMARESKTYRQILEFYYPGTQLGLTAQGLAWQTRESASFELKSAQLDLDAEVLTAAQRVLDALRSELGWTPDFKMQLRVFPSLDAYRNATGQPGWIAAYTRGHVISLQPLAGLKERSILDSTLRHEFIHVMVESRAKAGTPLWFREGLVLYLADPGEHTQPVVLTESEMERTLEHPGSEEALRRAYGAARTRAAQMVQQNGRDTVLQWLSSGLPAAAGYLSPQH